MAHQLTTNKLSKKVEMAYAGETPWHGLGQRLQPGASVEKWLEAAGMEWTIRRPRGADMILDLFLGSGMGSDQKGRAGTAWGLVNAVTEYVDHHATAKTDSHRLDRAFWGSGDELKTEALQLAQQQFA